MKLALAVAALANSTEAFAHAAGSAPSSALAWNWEPWEMATIAACASLYAIGLRKLWHEAGGARGIGRVRAAAFAAGLATLIVALASPLDALGAQLFSAHMAQHELLMLVAAPLLVLGRPLATWTWAFGPQTRRALGALARSRVFAAGWARMTTPAAAWIQHAVIVWIWHAPVLFDAALAHRGVHALQHISFIASALLFWWALLPRPGVRATAAAASLYLFTTMLHTGALGALFTLSPVAWYAPYRETTQAWGLSPVDDQQLGGLIMWIPAGAVYAAVGLALFGRWLATPRPIRLGREA